MLRCITSNSGMALRMISPSAMSRAGIVTARIRARRELRRIAMNSANGSIRGARIMMRMPIVQMFCIWVTSLVRRVTSEALENWSMFSNENDWTFENSPSRRFAAKPTPASAEKREFPKPAAMAVSASSAISPPVWKMYGRFPSWIPFPTILAISLGWTISQKTSKIMKMTASAICFL